MNLDSEQIVPIAQLIGYGVLGILAAFGLWWGQRRKPPEEQTMEIAGALIDSGAVKQLAAAIEANNVEQVQNRQAAERNRAVLHTICENSEDLAREIGELRREMRELGNAIRKR
ncbi:hypothetical protein [Chelativorans sp.]|uniref:hypothetical protein n=1 Tax=Chelativorans sp. TaxID=2203393 RepID=UPI00281278DA|nr:hypothetical protein [Chelativorans sp.]